MKRNLLLTIALLMLAAMLDDGLDLDAAASAALAAGCPRNEVYRARLRVRELFEDEE